MADTQKGAKSIENKSKMETKIRRIINLYYTLYLKIQNKSSSSLKPLVLLKACAYSYLYYTIGIIK